MAGILEAPVRPERASLANPLRLLVARETWVSFTFILLSFALGIFWFVALVTLLSTGLSLAVTVVGLPILAGTLVFWVGGARLERARFNAMLGEQIADPYKQLPAGSLWQKLKVRLSDRYVWLDLLYLSLLFPIGLVQFVIAITWASVALALITAPSWYWLNSDATGWTVDTLPRALLAIVIGIPVLLAMPYVLIGMVRGHAWLARNLLGADLEAMLSARVGELTESRSRAANASVDELRRIERDLHDGAQQRLTRLAMDLGMAKEKMDSDPEAAKALIAEAHEEAKAAMREIRDLARGIHPAVLTDRGLDAAISALAGRSPVPVTLDIDLPTRLPDAIESTAYFVVAEALTNVARHSNATSARVTARLTGGRLLVDITDNGRGGAVATPGGGLAGLADRVAGVDGTLAIDSPSGGPTTIHAELPCAS
ncbi:MAG TPA: sensor histidine kinase [Thermomicrobiales bacterium]|nr:sensor histidine kinase [Thermomicrobiales bacterium]HRA32364.1 sensor histidine kinase [Thermomicrobiales bacterium]